MFEKSLMMYQIVQYPPKSPIKRGTLIHFPLKRGVRGDQQVLKITANHFSNNLLYQFKIICVLTCVVTATSSQTNFMKRSPQE